MFTVGGNNKLQSGFTVIELMVTLGMFGAVLAVIINMTTNVAHNMVRESKMSGASSQLSLAAEIIAAELRMSSGTSPYYPTLNSSDMVCSNTLVVGGGSTDSIAFVVSQDDTTDSSGFSLYHVGYLYDSNTGTLYRGENKLSTKACPSSLPVGAIDSTSPLHSSNLIPFAEGLEALASASNKIFGADATSSLININFGINVMIKGETRKRQFSTAVKVRTPVILTTG